MNKKKDKPSTLSQSTAEKSPGKNTDTGQSFKVGENFVEEPTGSATMINLDLKH
ncbi:MAG: hypothetical protein ACYDEQ_06545 [Desulfocucumaceae bacterium]